MDFKIPLYFIHIITFIQASTDWTNECNKCSCTWVSGRKTANCVNRNLTEIPKDLSNTIKDIDFSNNEIYTLNSYEFSRINLRDVNKLKFQNCRIEQLSESAFFDLPLLDELDLSRNRILALSKDVFRHNVKLRVLILSYNNITVLEDGVFNNITLLKRIWIDNNQILAISPDTFRNLPVLNYINLSYNKIKRITFDLRSNLPNLNSLHLEGNPWICDCYLQEFRQIAVKNNLITNPVECYQPSNLKGTTWLDSVVFACIPEIVDPKYSSQITATSSNITLVCKVKGQPLPEVEWIINGHVIENRTENNQQKYVTLGNITDDYVWSILTIMNLNSLDVGNYKCIAKNAGGEAEQNITLILPPGYQNVGNPYGQGNTNGTVNFVASSAFWIIGFCIGLIIILLIVLLFVCCFCKKAISKLKTNKVEQVDDNISFINMYEINPVKKPERSTVPSSVDSGDTEISDVKKNLLDDEPLFDDYGKPIANTNAKPLPNYLDTNYPADFPQYQTRTPQRSLDSPTSSFASTTPLVYHRDPQNPFRSPSYDQLLDAYRTLPHTRPYNASPSYQPVISNQGYVTIPRKPRQNLSYAKPSNTSNTEAYLL